MQGIPMIIECDTCKARFRLDRMLLQGHLGARFRCRRCGGPIIVTTPRPPIARDPASPLRRHDPEGPSVPLSGPPAEPWADRRAAVRTSPSAASSQPLFEEESVADAKPSNLVDLQSLREAHRVRMLINADNLPRNIPIPEPPTPAEEAPSDRIPEDRLERRGLGIPGTLVLRDAKEASVVPPDARRKHLSLSTPRRNVRRWRMPVERPRPVVMILVAAIGTAVGCLVLYFLLLGLTLVLK